MHLSTQRAAVAYRLKADEPVGKGLKRVVRKELRSAIAQLDGGDPSDDAIHEARKSIKKVRAVLQLVGNQLDAKTAREHLRRAAHFLSPLRDAEALLETNQALCARKRAELVPTCRALATKLGRDKARVRQKAERRGAIRKAVRAMQRVMHVVRDRPWHHIDSRDLIAEIRRSYKRARRRMKRSSVAADSGAFHVWRKRVKTLWYGLRLLERRFTIGRQVQTLKRLETELGDDHNLAVLRTRIEKGDRVNGSTATPVVRAIAHDQHQLRRSALAIGRRALNARPRAFEKRLGQLSAAHH